MIAKKREVHGGSRTRLYIIWADMKGRCRRKTDTSYSHYGGRGISICDEWHGGKHYLAKRIIELFPPHVHYVEPFFGGGSVLFAKPDEWIKGHSEVVNDIYGDLVLFWKVLQSPGLFDEFTRLVAMTPFSSAAFEETKKTQPQDNVRAAANFFIRYRQSRQGLGKDFATMSRSRTRRGMNEQVSSWLSAVEGLPEAHERLKRVVIFSKDALRLIEQEDSPDTFFYLDPPYLKETRVAKDSYVHEMTTMDHGNMLDLLGSLNGRFLLSGYYHWAYADAAERYGWNRVGIEIDNKASGKRVKPKKTECLWMNY